MDDLNKYIELRYPNWLDYARHMARVHHFIGWENDLLNECIVELLKKDADKLNGMLARKTRKIVNGVHTTEIDKFILKIMNTNAFSPVAPFRKNVLGHKVIQRKNKKAITAKQTKLNGHDMADEAYTPELNARLDEMHTRNIARLKNNGFGPGAVALYTAHFIKGHPIKEYTDHEKEYITEINDFLLTRKTLLDD